MPAPSILNNASTMIEQMSTKIPFLSQRNQKLRGFWQTFEKDKVQVSNELLRFALERWTGGSGQKTSGNNAALPTGTQGSYVHCISGYMGWTRMHALTWDQIDTTKTSQQAVRNELAHQMSKMIEEAKADEDNDLHQDGTGALTNASSALTGTTQLTFAGATDHLGVKLIRKGMMVDVWDTGLATKRAGGPYEVVAVDDANKIVTFGATVTAIASTDRIVIAGADNWGPGTLATGSATWPARGTAAGLTGDSWRHGYPYAHTVDQTKYYLQQLRSTIPELTPPFFNGNSTSGLQFNIGLRLKHAMHRRRGDEGIANWFGIFSQAQASAYYDLGVNITNKLFTGESFGKSLDLLPSNHGFMDMLEFCGIPCIVDEKQASDRIDFINKAVIGLSYLYELETIEFPPGSGTRIWQSIDTNGRPTTGVEFGMRSSFDYLNYDPGSGSLAYGLTYGSGY